MLVSNGMRHAVVVPREVDMSDERARQEQLEVNAIRAGGDGSTAGPRVIMLAKRPYQEAEIGLEIRGRALIEAKGAPRTGPNTPWAQWSTLLARNQGIASRLWPELY
jgi:hypothetical protein